MQWVVTHNSASKYGDWEGDEWGKRKLKDTEIDWFKTRPDIINNYVYN